MPKFSYRATDGQGATSSGVVESPDRESAMDTLRDRGFTVLKLEAKKDAFGGKELPFLNKIPIKEIVIFSRQFSVLMGAKVPIVQALKTVAKQTQHRKLRAIVLDLASEVENGIALSTAMESHRNAFTDFFINMVKSGETTGRLEEVMNYMADQMERDYDLNSRIKGAMTYPIIVVTGMIVIGFIMMTFVVPKLTASLIESGMKLPWTTRLLIATSEFMKNNVVGIAIGAVLAGIAFRWWVSTESGRSKWDFVKLFIPVVGPLLQRIYLVRFTRSFGTMLSGGLDIPQALTVTSDIVGNAHYRKNIVETKKQVSDGHSITSVFMSDRTMPLMVPQMMAVGEETGRMQEVLERLTDFYTRDLENLVDNLVSAIEPLIMLAMGGAVGIMVAAIMLPMYQMAQQF